MLKVTFYQSRTISAGHNTKINFPKKNEIQKIKWPVIATDATERIRKHPVALQTLQQLAELLPKDDSKTKINRKS